MKQKTIDAMREVRLWTVQIVVPTIVIAGTILSMPKVRQTIAEKIKDVKTSIKNKFNKEKEV